ncbi:hypothetical protein JG687_00012960 [Phytophthora cactorum]|uniref:Uncharacterized protein n=1 Tax=Phytophthora cactorum TaxID=29920 RepID=A0A329SVR1_9STRA|nr:hypothetical protein Pcac1_g17989 [Phytophthora cactorum]KAG2803279.1 hypothetical protein PC112_g19243 [Phytophthora cactorum]KAG2882581.1 hypothetical protein PC114_g20959 [Phytophthora cactorum]KAG2940907.1 hypothetical protein PC115_g2241 [Phytophthora cactorum]KAG2996934.1 hypothetical protein PC118_g2181 [Phytophthora cactorum]
MNNHLGFCPRLVTVIGRITAQETLECHSDDSTWISPSIVERLKAKKYPSISRAERQVMDEAFASAVHRSGISNLQGMPEHILFPVLEDD